MPATGRRPTTPGVLATEQRGDRAGQQHDRVQRGKPVDRPGPTAGHGQLHMRGRERGGQEAQ